MTASGSTIERNEKEWIDYPMILNGYLWSTVEHGSSLVPGTEVALGLPPFSWLIVMRSFTISMLMRRAGHEPPQEDGIGNRGD